MNLKIAVLAVLSACLFAAPALATDQQVSPGTWRSTGPQPFDGRSDGIFYNKTYKSPRLIGNGDGYMPIGPTFYESFAQGDGKGVICEASSMKTGTAGYAVASGANTACDTTCGNSACVMAFEAALADAGDILACSDATADACLCQTTSIDPILDGCGANWEAPALGISLLTFSDGVKLAHVALLAQDIGPDMDAGGLDIAGDLTDNDGVELLSGMYGASGRPMVPGVDPAFKFCATVDVTDISGSDTFYVGWRDVTAPNATFASYNSYAVVGHNVGDTITLTEDDGGGTTTTDLNDADLTDDSGFVKYCALVSDLGVFSPTINGATPSNAASYTFDSGQQIIPIIHYLHGSDVADEIVLTEWEVSYQ